MHKLCGAKRSVSIFRGEAVPKLPIWCSVSSNPVPQRETHRFAMGHGLNDSGRRLHDEPSPSLPCSSSPNRIREFELMHQWCMKSCHSFSSDLSNVFATYVAEQALHHPFLMDALLALSSLHIANNLASANTNNIEISTNDGLSPASTETTSLVPYIIKTKQPPPSALPSSTYPHQTAMHFLRARQ